VKRVLIAEDEPSIVLSLEFLLGGAGYHVITARDGASALELARRHEPDLIVLDIMLPGMNGFEVCQALRADEVLGDVRILMLTARGGEHEIEKGRALGADAYVTKPFATRELVSTVRRLLETDATPQ
jgi:DNA-binding response OmpR family regulator